MKSYLLTLFSTGLILLLTRFLTEHYKALAGYLKWIASLILLFVTITPILNTLQSVEGYVTLPKFEESSPELDTSNDYLVSLAENELAARIISLLQQSGISTERVDCELYYDTENLLFFPIRIEVVVCEKDAEKAEAILKEAFSCSISVESKENL